VKTVKAIDASHPGRRSACENVSCDGLTVVPQWY
jgi:hypothetical protein